MNDHEELSRKELAELVSSLNKDVLDIKKRNNRVEADKAWEVSRSRAIMVTVITYITVYLFMKVIDMDKSHINALIPTIGFYLSIQTLPLLKKRWLKRIERNNKLN